MESNKYCIIMAGGVGTRFWPKSRQSEPKQFLDILGSGKSFIRHTYERFARFIAPENFLVVTNERYRDVVASHIPELKPEQILCEPIGRNTAPCIAYAAYTLYKNDPTAQMIVTPSDHWIINEDMFVETLTEVVDFAAENNVLMTIGIKPTRPETGYGYIQKSTEGVVGKVKCFVEKPNVELAQTFIQCGEFLWNSGIFVWSVGAIVEAFKKYLPDHDALFRSYMAAIGTPRQTMALEKAFAESRAISIDYGVMEKADNVYVRLGDFGWSDVGTWGSVYQLSQKDKYANVKPSKDCYTYNTRRCVISLPDNKAAVISGLDEYIVVDTDDVLMICPRGEEQSIKKFIDEVKFNGGDKFI